LAALWLPKPECSPILQKVNYPGIMSTVEYWEIIADKLNAAGWSRGLLQCCYAEGCAGSLIPTKRFIKELP